jgi:hypothetical protein
MFERDCLRGLMEQAARAIGNDSGMNLMKETAG